MSTLFVVRHGQASFGADNYDLLSPLGIKQSRRLGAWLAKKNFHLDAIWAGPLQRQRDTARHLVEGAADEGLQLPEPKILDDLREVSGGSESKRIFSQLAERLLEGELLAASQSVPLAKDASQLEVYELVMQIWASGQIDMGELESFATLEERTRRAFKHIIDQSSHDQRVAVVTSAGPLGVALRLALNLDPAQAVSLNFTAANSGVTELRFHRHDLKLVSFNLVGHLDQEEVTLI